MKLNTFPTSIERHLGIAITAKELIYFPPAALAVPSFGNAKNPESIGLKKVKEETEKVSDGLVPPEFEDCCAIVWAKEREPALPKWFFVQHSLSSLAILVYVFTVTNVR